MVVLLVLGAVPLFFGVRAATSDPVFQSLDSLPVPEWAAVETEDGVSGSRWCFIECRFRERTANSERGTEETAQAYEQALTTDGWRPWKVAYCPEQPVEGRYTCWQRDELTLDLWVREPACAADPLRNRPTIGPSGAPGEAAPAPEQECTGSVVSVKVRNAIDDERTGPQPSIDPSLTGVDPDPIFTDDPLSDLTPSPS
jgi:integrin beta 3